jgi:hypothetical protein
MELARSRVEATYFEGRPVLFPAMVGAWAEQLERTEHVAMMAERLAELDGLEPSRPMIRTPSPHESRNSSPIMSSRPG